MDAIMQAIQEATRRGCDYIKSSAGAWNEKQQQRDGLQVVDKYAPALVLLDSLVQTFTIKEAC